MEDIFKIIDNISTTKEIKSIKIFGVEYDKTPFFTIAIPTYKRALTLKEALESALNQDFEDYNIIVCDNNPDRNDETEIMMMAYKDNPKITYYKHSQNIGMAGNWNKCAILSNSERFILLHDDDVIFPQALTTFFKCLHHIDYDWSLIKPTLDRFSEKIHIPKNNATNHIMYKLHLINFLQSCAVGAPTCILMNKKKVIEIGGFRSERFPCIDYEMSIKMSYYGKAYLHSGVNSLGGYRISANESLSEETMDRYFIQRSLISQQLMRYFKIPEYFIRILDSVFEDMSLISIKRYYNMPDYLLKTGKRLPAKLLKIVIIKMQVFLEKSIKRSHKIHFTDN